MPEEPPPQALSETIVVKDTIKANIHLGLKSIDLWTSPDRSWLSVLGVYLLSLRGTFGNFKSMRRNIMSSLCV